MVMDLKMKVVKTLELDLSMCVDKLNIEFIVLH